jgi:hypothetical protein
MRRGEKEVLRAGLLNYVQRKLQRDVETLADLRRSMHDLRAGRSTAWHYAFADWHTFHGLASTQVLVIRRRRLQLEAAKLWDVMRTNNLIVSAAPKHGGLMRYEKRREQEEDPASEEACIARMKADEARIADMPDPETCPLEELEDDMLEAIATMQGGNELARDEAREARRILDLRHTHPTFHK